MEKKQSSVESKCIFEARTDTTSATICKHCGKEKFLHVSEIVWDFMGNTIPQPLIKRITMSIKRKVLTPILNWLGKRWDDYNKSFKNGFNY